MSNDAGGVLRELRDQRRAARDLVLKGAKLSGIDLARLRADGLDLRDSDLREAKLAEVRWKGCILRDTCLEAVDFREAILRLCDLDDARANNALLMRAHLENSTARGARFDGADLTSAVLTDTDFSRASLRGAILHGVSASGVNLRGADLRGARLRGAVLVDADLRGADLTEADLEGADLRGADLRGVIGGHAALPKEEGEAKPELPEELRALSAAMTPIVLEVLRAGGRRGVIPPEVLQQLLEEASRHRPSAPPDVLGEGTLKAVSSALDELGPDAFPKLLSALQQPNGGEPPAEVAAMIRRLGQELSLDDSATAEDLLQRLMRGQGRSSH